MPRFEYTPLDKERNEIRVLTLLPGPKDADIEILIDAIDFPDGQSDDSSYDQSDDDSSGEISVEPYEALSYAWGSADDPATIVVRLGPGYGSRGHSIEDRMSAPSVDSRNDESRTTLAVTQSLATALPHLRHPSLPRRLWIDAICVDQENRTERGEQVQLMGNIFKRASRVVVWLGPGDTTSGFALSTLEELGSKVEVDWMVGTMRSRPGEEQHWGDDQRSLPYSEETVGSLCSLLESSWFERLWVYQEVKLANPSAILMCGDKTIRWDCFLDAMCACRYKTRMPWDIELRFYQRVRLAFEMKRLETYIPLARLIQETQDCKCSDDRDRIYAMLSTVHPLERDLMVRPDYTLSVNEVYTQFAVRYWETQDNIMLLQHCELQDEDERPANLPSWVPRWNVRSEIKLRLVGHRVSGRSASSVQCDGVTLAATGVRGAVVREVKQFPTRGNNSYHDDLAVIRSLIPADALDDAAPYAGGGTLFEAYLRTFCCDGFAHREIPARDDWPSFDACKTELRLALSSQSELELELSVNLKNYLGWAYSHFYGRAFFTTQQGHVGLCPKRTRPSDVICILLGCLSSIVLRPTTDGQYLVVGECYIQGLMHNEALLGPLPRAIEYVLRWDGQSGYWAAYLNRETGEVGPEDPRLSSVPLPPGWQIVRHEMEMYTQGFIRDDVDDKFWTTFDPRLLPEELRARGVPLETFEIV